MNILLFRPEQRQGGIITADARQALHIASVLQAQPGDTLRIGELGGLLGEARLLPGPGSALSKKPQPGSESSSGSGWGSERGSGSDLGPRPLQASTQTSYLELIALDRPPPPKLPLTVLLAMPRPKVLRRLFQALASLGVPRIILFNAWRVEKSYWQTPWLRPEAIENNLWLGLEQAGDTRLPEVLIRKRFKPFVEDELPTLLADGARGWLAHPGLVDASAEPRPALPMPQAPVPNTVLAIGPEGGFIPYEVDLLLAAGLTGLSLGPRILRVDTAIATLIGKLFY